MNFLHTVNIHDQLALEVKLTCEILEEKSSKVGDVAMAMVDVKFEMTLKGQGMVQLQLDSFTCGFIAEIMPPWHCLFWLGLFSLAESHDYVEVFLGLWERPLGGGWGMLERIKGRQGLAFTELPTCSSSPGALVQLGDSDAGLPALGMEGGQGKRSRQYETRLDGWCWIMSLWI